MTITNELKPRDMEPTVNVNNNIFLSAFIGVILFIGAIGYTITNFSHIAALQISSMLIIGLLAFASVALITRAVKADKNRVGEQA